VSPRKVTVKPQETPEGYTRVTVAGNYQLNHDGTIYGPGETVAVPEDKATSLEQAGIVTT